MYSFERFTERAKKALTLAQEEAEKHRHSYIGTEHLLLALIRVGDGLAAKALDNLHVEIKAVRETIESVLGRNEQIFLQHRIPTSRVKKVIELSFEEAQRMGNNYVGTEHLLLGLLIEGEGIAAHVLKDMGVTLEVARAEINRLLPEAAAAARPAAASARALKPSAPPLGHDALQVISYARILAAAEKAPTVSLDHIERVLASQEVRALLDLSARIAEYQAALEAATNAAEPEEGARISPLLRQAHKERERAETAWQRSLGKSRRRRRPPS